VKQERKKNGNDLADYPPWDMKLWCDATGGMPYGHLYGMRDVVDPRVPCRTNPINAPTQIDPLLGYVDIGTVDKLIQKEREEALKREAIHKEKQERLIQKEREEARKKEVKLKRRYLRALQQAMQ
jgi:hypothetical protein